MLPLPAPAALIVAAPPQKPAPSPAPAAKKKPAATPPAKPKAPAPTLEPARTTPAFPNTAEGAVRGLLVAMMSNDIAAVRAVILPVPTADLKLLVNGQPLTDEQKAQALPFVAGMPIHALQPGETAALPGELEKKLTVTPEMVGEDRAVLLPQRFPQPLVVRRLNGIWRVDAAPLIAARRAATKTGG